MSDIVTIGDCTLYHADCMDVLPTLPKVDAVVTDPPYGIGFKYGQEYQDNGGDNYMKLISVISDIPRVVLQYPEEMMKYFVPIWGAPNDCFAWCYNSHLNRQFRIFGFWGIIPEWDAVKQPAKNPTDKRITNKLVRSYDWCCDIQQIKNISAEKTEHPCQVPELLMQRILMLCRKANTILDPFMGSGTTGVACVNLGRKFIGIEKERKYFDIACERIQRATNQGKLFAT